MRTLDATTWSFSDERRGWPDLQRGIFVPLVLKGDGGYWSKRRTYQICPITAAPSLRCCRIFKVQRKQIRFGGGATAKNNGVSGDWG
jgi:hypothetical protein